MESNYSISPAFSNACKSLQGMKVPFKDLDLESQTALLLEIFKVFQCKPVYGDLSKYGGSGTVGRIEYNKNIGKMDSVIMIDASITGLFEKCTDLKIV